MDGGLSIVVGIVIAILLIMIVVFFTSREIPYEISMSEQSESLSDESDDDTF